MSTPNTVNQLMSCNNQLPVVSQYFTNIAAIQNLGYYNKSDSTKSRDYATDVSKHHNEGILSWIKAYYVLCKKKHIAALAISTTSSQQATWSTHICETGLWGQVQNQLLY